MSRRYSARLEDLEGRMLLSGYGQHHAAPHVRHAEHPQAAKTPLDLSGTLTVDNAATVSNQNADGSSTTTVPVQGQLAPLGEVHGLWTENVDSTGGITGPDTVRLTGAQGSILIEFNNENPGRPHKNADGHIYYQHNQRLMAGIGAYAHTSEQGTIGMVITNNHKYVVTMTIQSRGA